MYKVWWHHLTGAAINLKKKILPNPAGNTQQLYRLLIYIQRYLCKGIEKKFHETTKNLKANLDQGGPSYFFIFFSNVYWNIRVSVLNSFQYITGRQSN